MGKLSQLACCAMGAGSGATECPLPICYGFSSIPQNLAVFTSSWAINRENSSWSDFEVAFPPNSLGEVLNIKIWLHHLHTIFVFRVNKFHLLSGFWIQKIPHSLWKMYIATCQSNEILQLQGAKYTGFMLVPMFLNSCCNISVKHIIRYACGDPNN